LSLSYRLVRGLFGLLTVLIRSDLSKDVELLVLRQENQALRRQLGGRPRWGHVDRVLVVDLARLGRQNKGLAEVSALLEQAAAELFVLEDIRDKDGVAVPVDLEVQIRAVFAELAEEGGPGFALEMAPSWYHDGELSLLRRIMQAAQAHLAEVEGDAAPGFTVPPAVYEARAQAARAEKAFAEKLLELSR
jgi:hypothetical protein